MTAAQEGHVIDRTATTPPRTARPRRVFHSKVDTIRPTYGFEDVSLAPGIDTVEPGRRRPLPDLRRASTLAIPMLAAAMDAVVDPAFAGVLAGLGGLAVLNLEGVQTRYDDPAAVLERIATAPDRRGPGRALGGLPARRSARTSSPRRLEEIHAAGSQGGRRGDPGRRPPVRPVLRGARRRPVPRPVPGLAAPATSPPATTRSRSPSSRGSCRSRSRSATRPPPRPRSR